MKPLAAELRKALSADDAGAPLELEAPTPGPQHFRLIRRVQVAESLRTGKPVTWLHVYVDVSQLPERWTNEWVWLRGLHDLFQGVLERSGFTSPSNVTSGPAVSFTVPKAKLSFVARIAALHTEAFAARPLHAHPVLPRRVRGTVMGLNAIESCDEARRLAPQLAQAQPAGKGVLAYSRLSF